ncbi:hypothetical protein BD289DRAFT_450244 [Coniella lustricola]|uniref:AAA+ ATPase domain-containing protein n=1 Tax=Coniella lustricola TaxID=2025994 RepID=A0A2T3AJG9_9PEZI|nr:hypothetical protein BD289DRAFT_450244 [Coniella lustricola]
MAEDAVIETVHSRYIELLEKRIAQLQTLVDKADEKNGEKKEESTIGVVNKDGKKEDPKSDDKDGKKDDGKANDKKEARYRYVLRRWDKNAGTHKDEAVGPDWFEKTKNKDSAYVYRRIYDPETGEKGAYSEIEVEDPELIELLKKDIGKYPGISFDTETLSMNSPFPAIIHNYDKLQESAKASPNSQVCKDLENLLERVRSTPELDSYFKLRGNQEDGIKAVTFETLWTAFAPGTLIVVRNFNNIEQIMSVADSPIPYSPISKSPRLWMWAWTWDYDGHNLVKVWRDFKFDRFRGTKTVTELEYVPLAVYPEAEKLKRDVLARSQRFLKYTVQCAVGSDQVLKYDGFAYADERRTLANDEQDKHGGDDENPDYNPAQDEENSSNSKLVLIKGEVISDAAAYAQNTSSLLPIGDRNNQDTFIDRQPTTTEDDIFFETVSSLKPNEPLPMEDNFLLLPPRVLGYATRQRVWGQFHLDSASEKDKPNPHDFKQTLQLSQRYKDMIESLVAAHMHKVKRPITDIVEEKGKGLVLLLHGPPGVGKTLTAETVARATGKPLFVVSVAEIGLDASRAERKLEKIFALATKWGAVLLIDEADVFLETRNRHSPPSRNALVSVLLRVLEYYEGIIMMTTNRIKAIDVAVVSRIHLAVRYTDLDAEQMRNIFKYYLNQLRPHLIHDQADTMRFVDQFGHMYALNGRQIRNVVQAAQAYASFSLDNDELGVEAKNMMLVAQQQAQRYAMAGGGYGAPGLGYGGGGYGMPPALNMNTNAGPGMHGGYEVGYPQQSSMAGYTPVPRRPDGKMTTQHLRAVCDLTREFQEQLKEEARDQRNANEAR